MLYPRSQITNLDLDPQYANAPCNQQERVRFVCGDATNLPFENQSFDAVTMFDLLEHIPSHKKAVSEALRVLRPDDFLLISSPNENWRFPYYGFMKSICPSEADVMAEWGHVRRGYTLDEPKTSLVCPASATPHLSIPSPFFVMMLPSQTCPIANVNSFAKCLVP